MESESLASKTLVAGVIDGHNIWRGDLAHAFERADALRSLSGDVAVSTSTSLLHVPHGLRMETALDPALLASALDAVQAHLEKEGDLRSHAIAQGLLVA